MFSSRLLYAVPAALALVATLAHAAPPNIVGSEPVVDSPNVIDFVGPKVAGGPPNILYAPSNADDPAYRASIAGFTGGVVDYFDAHAGTPTLAFLMNYDVVYTWTNSTYFDRVAMGNVLADYVDAGGKVLLGVFCTFTLGNSLGGRIMDADYCPVRSPSGNNHFTGSNYSGNGTSWQHRDVLFYTDTLRDFLEIQGFGVRDGNWNDGELATAHRPDGRVMYMNALGAPGGGAGDQTRMVANFAKWQFIGGSLFGATESGNLVGINTRSGVATVVGPLPLSPVGDADFSEATGAAICSSGPFGNRIHAFAIGNGAPVGGVLATPAGNYTAIEAIGGTWWGCSHAFACGPSSISVFDPATGAVLSGPTATGANAIVGMSFNFALNRMYYVTDFDCGVSHLYWNSAPGAPLNDLGVLGFAPGAIEFGPDDNLYGVNVGANSKLYRINPTTGAISQIGTLTGLAGMSALMRVSGALTVDAGGFGDGALAGVSLASPVPNPSRRGDDVVLRFALPAPGRATFAVYDMAGRRIWSHSNDHLAAGAHVLAWDGRDANGAIARAGVYVVKLETGQGERSVKLLRL